MLDSKLLRAGLLCGLAGFLSETALAIETDEPKTELGFLFGATLSDRDLVGEKSGFGPVGPSFGVRAAHMFGDSFNGFVDATASRHGSNRLSAGNVNVVDARVGLEFFLAQTGRARWFVQGAVGLTMVDYRRESLDFDRPLVSAGFGQRWLTDRAGFWRWEARVNRMVQDEGLRGADVANVQVLLGWLLPVGGPPPDLDADGVRDRKDSCPGTLRGAVVDASGCPSDGDGDGVYDGIDRCASTPQGSKVDSAGCPSDSDGDGVAESGDTCPQTPRGAKVDPTGCPIDSDEDGVYDGLDRCPATPKDAVIDEGGCPIDSDGDGVWDGIDRCLETSPGTPVDPFGCPKELPPPTPPPPPIPPPPQTAAKVEPAFIPAARNPVVLRGVNFDTDSAKLIGDSKAILDLVAESLKANPEVRVEVAGHTDSVGGDRHNEVLSQFRAETVRDYLIGAGVPAARIEAKGYGKSQPVADNKTVAGRAKNRRVELRRL